MDARETLFEKIRKLNFGDTYALKKIVKFFNENNLEFKYYNSATGINLYNHGCRLILNKGIQLSIQTHTDVVGDSFAETLTFHNGKIKYITKLGYSDVIRHKKPKELFQHIKELIKTINSDDFNLIDEENTNEDN